MRSVFDSGGTTAGSLRSRSRAIGARSECTRHRSRPSATYGKERRSAPSLGSSSWRSAPYFILAFSRSLSSPSVRSTGSNETPAQRLLRIAFGYWPVPSNTERLEIHAPSLIARQGSGLQRAELPSALLRQNTRCGPRFKRGGHGPDGRYAVSADRLMWLLSPALISRGAFPD